MVGSRAHSGKVDPVFRSNAQQNKDLEHVRDSIFCERALGLISYDFRTTRDDLSADTWKLAIRCLQKR